MIKENALRELIGKRTQKAFAEKYGIRKEIVSKWLSGKRNISNDTLSEIAKAEGYKLSIEFKLEKL